MRKTKIFTYIGLCILAVAIAVGISGNYRVALLLSVLSTLFFWWNDFFGKEERINTDVSAPMPSPEEIKKYRIEHPGTSIPEAINSLRE